MSRVVILTLFDPGYRRSKVSQVQVLRAKTGEPMDQSRCPAAPAPSA